MASTQIPKNFKNDVRHASHNLSLVKTTTLHPGLLIPIYSRKCLAGDKIRIDLDAILKSDPLVTQLFSSFKLKFAVFFDSDSNYYGFLDNNTRLSVSDLLNRTRHSIDLKSFFPSSSLPLPSNIPASSVASGNVTSRSDGVRPCSLLDFAGIPTFSGPITSDDNTYYFPNIDIGFILTYLNIFRNYYANNQEESAPYIGSLSAVLNTSAPLPPYGYFPLRDIDNLMMLFRLQSNGVTITGSGSSDFPILPATSGGVLNPYTASLNTFYQYLAYIYSTCGGLFIDTHLPDEWTNLLSSQNSSVSSTVSTVNNQFTIDTLRFQNKLQAWIDRLFVSGGRFRNWLRTVWGVSTSRDMDIPELLGVSQMIINPQGVMATSSGQNASPSGDVDLGQQGGSFNNTLGVRRFSFRASTPGRVMIIVSLVPMVEYCQGIDPELVQTSFNDEYNPEFSNLGFQNVPRMFYSVFPNRNSSGNTGSTIPVSTWFNGSVGKQVAWLHYMTDVNRCHGEFGANGSLSTWVLQRRFSVPAARQFPLSGFERSNISLFSLTQYINPLEYQYLFHSGLLTDFHWYLQVGIRSKWYRPVGKRVMPTIGR